MTADMHAKAAATAAAASKAVGSGVQLLYASHASWPFVNTQRGCVDIAVLDSSFNPPSQAHMALLTSQPVLAEANKSNYDGHLLLFSTQNADKGAGKPGDATLAQRAAMMTLMAKDLERSHTQPNVAVGLVDKPLIFDKSTLTHQLLERQRDGLSLAPNVSARLHWVVGFDTLYRVFQLKYYASSDVLATQCRQFFEQQRTTFVCARRDSSSFPSLQGSQDQEAVGTDELLQSDNVQPWVQAKCIAMLDIDPRQAALSSTKIRAHLSDTSTSDAHKKQVLQSLVPPSLIDYLVDNHVYEQPC